MIHFGSQSVLYKSEGNGSTGFGTHSKCEHQPRHNTWYGSGGRDPSLQERGVTRRARARCEISVNTAASLDLALVRIWTDIRAAAQKVRRQGVDRPIFLRGTYYLLAWESPAYNRIMLVEKGIIDAALASRVCESLEEQRGKSMPAAELLHPNAKVYEAQCGHLQVQETAR